MDKSFFIYFFTGLVVSFALQFFLTRLTHSCVWSKQISIRNTVIVIAFAGYMAGWSAWIFLLPIFLEIIMEIINYKFFSIDPWITTHYLYSDYFESFVSKHPTLYYYTEGYYASALNLNTLDTSPENAKKIIAYGQQIIKNAKKYRCSSLISLSSSRELDLYEVSHQGQLDKYEWIAKQCHITKGTRVLEIGFGKTDLMRYLRDKGAIVSGVNLSSKQVELAKEQGFHAVCCNFWDMPKHIQEIGQDYDVVISNGSLEYYRLTCESESVYEKVFANVYAFLKPNGIYFCTTIHLSVPYRWSFNNVVMGYLLWSGNDGSYPYGRDGLTKHAVKAGFHVVKQENHWLDYYLFSCLWVASFRKQFGLITKNISVIKKFLILLFVNPHFVQNFLTYNFTFSPWFWQFLPQGKDYFVPASHEWIIFQKL